MSSFLIILLIIIFCWPWISRVVGRWFRNFMSHRAEDMMRRMMGMPPREKKRGSGARSAFSGAGRKRAADNESAEGAFSRRKSSHRGKQSIAALMQLVAVDVTYTEIKEFTSTSIGEDGKETFRYIFEEQITDVKFEEIKDRRS